MALRDVILTLALVAATGAGACGASGPTEGEPFELGAEVTIAPGETARASDGSLKVRFVRVLDDSRCPTDATCIWAGEVKLRLAVEAGEQQVERDVREGESTTVAARKIELLRVRPQPVSTRKIDAGDYRASLRITATP